MRNDFGTRPFAPRFPYKSGKSVKKQTADDKLDESLGERRGARVYKNTKVTNLDETSLEAHQKHKENEKWTKRYSRTK